MARSLSMMSSSTSAKPMIEFSGVRSSCETDARNSPLTLADSNSETFASAISVRRRSSVLFAARSWAC